MFSFILLFIPFCFIFLSALRVLVTLLDEEEMLRNGDASETESHGISYVEYMVNTSLAYSFNFRGANCTLPLQLLSVGVCICCMFGLYIPCVYI